MQSAPVMTAADIRSMLRMGDSPMPCLSRLSHNGIGVAVGFPNTGTHGGSLNGSHRSSHNGNYGNGGRFPNFNCMAMDSDFNSYRNRPHSFISAVSTAESTPFSTQSANDSDESKSGDSTCTGSTTKTMPSTKDLTEPTIIFSAGSSRVSSVASTPFNATPINSTPMNGTPLMRSCLSSPYSSMSPRVSPASLLSLPQSDTRLSVDISREEFAEDLTQDLGFIERYQATPYQQFNFGTDPEETSTEMEDDSFPFDEEKELNMQLTSRWILQPFESVMDDHVHFGNVVLAQNGRHHIFDSHGMNSGVHEWEVQILQMDRHKLQEIGVVSTQYIQSTVIDNGSSAVAVATAATNKSKSKKKQKQRGTVSECATQCVWIRHLIPIHETVLFRIQSC